MSEQSARRRQIGFGLRWGGAALTAVLLAALGGLPGLLGGAAVLVALRYDSVPLAFAVAHVGALSAVPLSTAQFIAFEVGVAALVVGDLSETAAPWRTSALWAAATVAVGAVLLLGPLPLHWSATAIVLGFGAAMYGIHRYEVVRLGVAEENE